MEKNVNNNENLNNGIMVFNHEQFGEVRGCVSENKEWLCLSDVCKALDICNPARVKSRLREGGITTMNTPVINQYGVEYMQPMTYIDEPNLYRCIFQSRKPEAELFQDWVCEEVLPRIRKTGGYLPVHEEESAETILSKALLIMERTVKLQREELEQKSDALGQLAPLAEYADSVLLSPTCYTMTEVAKSLSMTVHELQHLLHSWGVIYRSPSGIWMLYADYLQQGYEAYRTRKGENVHGDVMWTSSYLVWTERGKHFIHRLVGERIAA